MLRSRMPLVLIVLAATGCSDPAPRAPDATLMDAVDARPDASQPPPDADPPLPGDAASDGDAAPVDTPPSPTDITVPMPDVTAACNDLELGTGQNEWIDLPPVGGRTEIVRGPQNGYHIYGRVRFACFRPDVFVSFRVTPVEGGLPITERGDSPLRRQERRGLVRVGSAFESSSGELVILTEIRGPGDVIGRRFRLQAFVREAATDRVAGASREIVIVDDVP